MLMALIVPILVFFAKLSFFQKKAEGFLCRTFFFLKGTKYPVKYLLHLVDLGGCYSKGR